MSPAHPNQSQIRRAFVWPTVVALAVAAVMIVERLQVDWTVACSLHSVQSDVCGRETLNMMFAWAPAAFAFGLAHIVGASGLYGDPNTRLAIWERLAKFVAYFAIHVFPAFGWYFFYVGLAAGFLISLTVVGIIVAFPFGAMAAGFVAGLLLAIAAGPSLRSAHHAGWKRLLWSYGSGSAFGTLILTTAQALFDPAFGHLAGPDGPWLTAAGALSAVALSCIVVSFAALKANFPHFRLLGGNSFRSAVKTIAMVAAVLVLPVHRDGSQWRNRLPAERRPVGAYCKPFPRAPAAGRGNADARRTCATSGPAPRSSSAR